MSVTSQILAGAMPRLSSVRPAGKYTVDVTWAEGERTSQTDRVDLSPLILSMKFYRPLRANQALFETVHLIDDGEAIAWGDDDAIDQRSLRMLEQIDDFELVPGGEVLVTNRAAIGNRAHRVRRIARDV